MKTFKININGDIGKTQVHFFKEKHGSLNTEIFIDKIIERIAENNSNSKILIKIETREYQEGEK